ncbi:MAG: ABC transporter permease [Acidimicrobiales bacterium]
MRQAWTIALKDLKLGVRDRSAFILGIAAPLGLAAIFSFVFNPIQDLELNATYAVYDEDGGPIADQLLTVLREIEQDDGTTIVEVQSRQEAVDLVDVDPFGSEDGADAAFLVPAGFSSAVQSAQPVELEVIRSRSSLEAAIAVAIGERFAGELTYASVAVGTGQALGDPADPTEAANRALATPTPVSLAEVEVGNRELDGTTFYAAGLAIFFLFFTVQYGVMGLLAEREAGTLTRLLAAPIPRSAIIAGKALMAFILGLVSMTVLVVATTVLFGADWGNPVGVAMLVVAGIISALGIMAIVASFASTAEQAANYSAMVSVVLGFMGGTFFPVSQAGGILARLRFLTPHGWFMQGLGDLADGEITNVLSAVAALLAFGLVTGTIAVVGLGRRLQP